MCDTCDSCSTWGRGRAYKVGSNGGWGVGPLGEASGVLRRG